MRVIFIAAAFAALATPVHAQLPPFGDVIIESVLRDLDGPGRAEFEAGCMAGSMRASMRSSQFGRMREGAQRTMSSYVSLTRPGAPTNVSALYIAEAPSWTRVSDGATVTDMHAITDPLAPRMNGLPPARQFVYAADGETIAGVWLATDPAGAPIGYYQGFFQRDDAGAWRLASLHIGEGPDHPRLTAYCHEPGDIDEHAAAQRANNVAKDEVATSAPSLATMERVEQLPPSAAPSQ